MSKIYDLMCDDEDRRNGNQRRLNAPEGRLLPANAESARWTKPAETKDELDFDPTALAQILLRRRNWILGCTAATLVIAALICFFMTPQYKAVSKIQILNQGTGGLALGTAGAQGESSDALDFNLTLQTQLGVLRSNNLAEQVIRELNLAPNSLSAKQAADALLDFQKHLTVEAVPGTRLIEVTYTHSNPKAAADIVNRLLSDFVEYTFQVRYEATTKATDFLGHQLTDLKSQVEQAQGRAVQLAKQSGIFGEDEHHNIILTRLEQLNSEVTSAESDRVVKETIYRLARSGNPELVANMLGNQTGSKDVANSVAVLTSLRQQEATLNAEYADASAKYGPAYPRLIQLKQRQAAVHSDISTELRKLVDRANNEYQLALSRETAAKQSFSEQKSAASQMNDKATEYLLAKHEAESGQVLYEHLLEKLKEAGVLAGLRSSQFHVVDQAIPPTRPAKPNVPLYLGFAGLSGILIGMACAFVVDSMDRTVRNVDEIEITSDVPVLGVIPTAGLLKGPRLLRLNSPSSAVSEHPPHNAAYAALLASLRNPAIAEAFRSLRSSLLMSQPTEFDKVLMVTSAMPQEGKSFTSLNLAATLARGGGNVLLVDADLRRGTLSRILDQGSSIGLSEILSREADPTAAYQQIADVAGVTFLPVGDCSHFRPELLETPQMAEQILRWRGEFAYVVIDTAPILPVSDAIALTPNVDAVILVVRFAVTTRQAVTRCIRILKTTRVNRLAVLVNDMDVRSPEFYHYSGSKGYAGYHYGETSEDTILVREDARQNTERKIS